MWIMWYWTTAKRHMAAECVPGEMGANSQGCSLSNSREKRRFYSENVKSEWAAGNTFLRPCHTRSKECTFLPLKWKNDHRLPLKWPFMPRNMFLSYISGDIMCKELTLSSLDYSRKITLCFCVYLNARSYWLCSLTNMKGHVNTLNCVFNQGKVKNSLSKTRLAQIFAHYPSFALQVNTFTGILTSCVHVYLCLLEKSPMIWKSHAHEVHSYFWVFVMS